MQTMRVTVILKGINEDDVEPLKMALSYMLRQINIFDPKYIKLYDDDSSIKITGLTPIQQSKIVGVKIKDEIIRIDHE